MKYLRSIESYILFLIESMLSYIPTSLPVGMTEFNDWATSILSMSKVPINDSTRFTLAVMILHLNPAEDRKAKRYFVKALNKGAANEVGNAVAMELKAKQAAAMKAEQEAKIVQDIGSTPPVGAPDAPIPVQNS